MPRKRGSRTPHPGPPLQGSRLRGNDADEIRPVWRHLQSRFWTHLVDKPLGFDHTAGPNLGALLDDRRPVRVARGMQVYSDAYASGLRRALAVNFPALARVVSGEDFAGLAAAFLRSHPPSGMDFRRLGADFAAFVRSHRFAADYGVDPRVLGDLVALEQAQLEVLDERDDPVALAPQSLAAVAPSQWENARFGFARALRLLRASYDVLPVVEAVGRGKIPERPAAGPVSFLVYRAEGKVHTELLAASDAVVLEHLLAGETFGTACGAAVRDGAGEEAVARSAAGVLVALSARRLLCRLDLGEH